MLETLWSDLLDPKDPLVALRQKGWDRFCEIGLPKPKQEAFQYLAQKLVFPALAEQVEGGLEGADLCFVDGFYMEKKIPSPLVALPIDKALRNYGLFLQNRLARMLKEEADPLAALNCAFQGKGAFLYVPPKCKAALQIGHLFTQQATASPRIHLYLGRHAELNLTQISQGNARFCNLLIDIVLDEGATLHFTDRHEGNFQAVRATLKRDSKLKGLFIGKNTRTSLNVQLTEENSEAEVLGLCQLKGSEESHIHATIEHAAPHTRSRQHFKSVLEEKGRFSFEGKIFVRPEAQKTEAYQLNNNLILSDEAVANAKPNLEIFADDVKASHGATFGKLNDEELFYLRSRGLGLQEAREWLIRGFCKEILDHAP